jgi:hypothetical protein
MTPEDDKYLEKRLQSFKAELEADRRERELKRMTLWTSRSVFGLALFMGGVAFATIVSTCQMHFK